MIKRNGAFIRILGLLLFVFQLAPEARAEAPAESERTVRVFCLALEPPFLVLDEDQKPSGFFIDLIQSLAKQEDMALTVRVGTWEDLCQSLYRDRKSVV